MIDSEIAYYMIVVHVRDDIRQPDVQFPTLWQAQTAARRAIKNDGAFKIEIFGYRADDKLFHPEPVRVHFGAGDGLAEHVARFKPRTLQRRNDA